METNQSERRWRKKQERRQVWKRKKREEVRRPANAVLFERLLNGASMQDLSAIYNIEKLHGHVYLLNSDDRSLRNPTVGEIAWPIIWLLTRFHRKHIWCTSKQPDMSVFLRDLVENEKRLFWHFKRPDDDNKLWFKIPHSDVAPPNQPLHPAFRAWLAALRGALTHAAKQPCADATRRRLRCIPLVRTALDMLKRSGLVPVPNDKEPGFTLLKRQQ